MAQTPYKIKKMFNNFKGLDKRSSDLVRKPEYATEISNAIFRESGAISKRNGYKAVGDKTGTPLTYGLGKYIRTNDDGSITEELLNFSDKMYKLEEDSFTITTSIGSTKQAYYTMYFDETTSVFKFKIEEEDGDSITTIMDESLSDGFIGGSVQIGALATLINNLTDYSCTEVSTVPAAFVDVVTNVEITSGGTIVDYKKWSEVTTPGTFVPFPLAYAEDNQTYLENYSTVNLDDNLYVCSGYDDIVKYDGNMVFRAGLPQPINTVDNGAFGTPDYEFKVTKAGGTATAQTTVITCPAGDPDNGNLYPGDYFSLFARVGQVEKEFVFWFNHDGASEPVLFQEATFVPIAGVTDGKSADEVADYVKTAINGTTGFSATRSTNDVIVLNDEEGAVKDPDHGSFPLTSVDASRFTFDGTGSSIVGTGLYGKYFYKVQYVYADFQSWDTTDKWDTSDLKIYEGPLSEPLEFQLDDIDFIDIDVEKIDINDGFDIVARSGAYPIKAKVWRTLANMDKFSTYYFVGEVEVDHTTATSQVEDTIGDKDLAGQEELLIPTFAQKMPPKGRYMTVWQDQLIIAGKARGATPTDASPDTVYYSDILNPEAFDIGNNSFVISSGESDEIRGMGVLKDVLFVFQERSIHAVAGELATSQIRVSLLSKTANVGCLSHGSIQELNNELLFLSSKGVYSASPKGLQEKSAIISPEFKDSNLNFSKAVAFNWREKELYILMIPAESGTDPLQTDSSTSKIFVYDYFNDAWFKWDNLDISGGIKEYKGKVYFSNRGSQSNLYQFLDKGNNQDYIDHAGSIDFVYKTNWEALDHPSVFKKYLRLKIHALNTDGKFESGTYTLSTTVEKDYNAAELGSIDMNFAGTTNTGWGLQEWGNSVWGAGILSQMRSKLPTGKSRSMRFGFKNSVANENVLISGYELECVTPFQEAMKE